MALKTFRSCNMDAADYRPFERVLTRRRTEIDGGGWYGWRIFIDQLPERGTT